MRRIILFSLIILLSYPCMAKDKDPILPNIFITDIAEEYIEPEDIVLKGYAEYLEDNEAIYLKDDNDEFVLNLKVPQKITSKRLGDEYKKTTQRRPVTYSKFGAEEYQIGSRDKELAVKSGGLSIGTSYGHEVDYSEFEQTAGFFTQYDIGRFGIKTSYERTIGSTYGNYIDNIYLSPEVRLNKFISVKEVLSANMTTNRRKTEFILSLDPLANIEKDRLNLEFGAAQTYDEDNSLIRSKLKFNTRFKL